MILVDTSVVVDFLRKRDPRIHQILNQYQGAICGITRAEILLGARDPSHFQTLLRAMAGFPVVPMGEALWDKAGEYMFSLKSAGITVPLPDGIIAALAIEHDVELWTRDNHFALMQPILPSLRLFVEPP